MSLPDGAQLGAQSHEQALNVTANLEPVLQCTRRLEGDALRCSHACAKRFERRRDDLYGIAGQAHDPACLLRVSGIIAEQVRVVPYHRPAAGRVDHNGLDPRGRGIQVGPPRVDIAARLIQRSLRVAKMVTDGPAAAGLLCDLGLDPDRIEHPGRGAIDGRQHGRLSTAAEQQYFARMLLGWSRPRRTAGAYLGSQSRQYERNSPSEAKTGTKQPAACE